MTATIGNSRTRALILAGCAILFIAGFMWLASVPSYAADPAAVTTEDELRAAMAEGGEIVVQNNIVLTQTDPVTVPEGVSTVLRGNTGGEALIASETARWPVSRDNAALLKVAGELRMEGLTVDSKYKLRTVFIANGGSMTMGAGATVCHGIIGLSGQKNNDYGGGIQVGQLTGGTAAKHAVLTMEEGSMVTDCQSAGMKTYMCGIGIGIGGRGEVYLQGGVIEGSRDLYDGTSKAFRMSGGGVGFAGSGGYLDMTAGQIRANEAKTQGGGVFVKAGGNRFIMSGGTIKGNTTCEKGGGVCNFGQFEMSGGVIEQNTACETIAGQDCGIGGGVYVGMAAALQMSAGTIQNNTAKADDPDMDVPFISGQGGGIFTAGQVSMSGGQITGNRALRDCSLDDNAGCGGGVAISGGLSSEKPADSYAGTFTITGGQISGNQAARLGGGIYFNDCSVEQGSSDPDVRITPGTGFMNLQGTPVISGNMTGSDPGNICLTSDAVISVTGQIDKDSAQIRVTPPAGSGAVIAEGSGYRISTNDAQAFFDDQGNQIYGFDTQGRLIQGGKMGTVPIDEAVITDVAEGIYTGEEITQDQLKVTLDGRTLVKDQDYLLFYENNINAGTAVVRVMGYGEYTGEKEADFTIQPRDLSQVTADPIRDYLYRDGAAIEPVVSLHNGDVLLSQGTDFTTTYENNTAIGTGTVNITAAGTNYTGSRSESFQIVSREGKNIAGSEEQLTAFAQAGGTIYVEGSIALQAPLEIAAGTKADIVGDGNDAAITLAAAAEQMITVNGDLTVENIRLDAAKNGRVLAVGSTGEVYVNADAVIENGKNNSMMQKPDGIGVYVNEGGKFHLEGGTIRGNSKTGADLGQGGGVYNAGTMTISAGDITGNNNTRGGGVYNAGSLAMNGGRILKNQASGSLNNNTISAGGGLCNTGGAVLSGGLLRGNSSDLDGGAIANEGTMEIGAARIRENKAGRAGGGVITSGILTMTSGEISDNQCTYVNLLRYAACGGGVFVKAGLFRMDGGAIENNSAKSTYSHDLYTASLGNGGGVYVSNDSDDPCCFVMNGGLIRGNRAATYSKGSEGGHGGGLYLMGGKAPANAALNGGSITGNSASRTGGGIFVNNREYAYNDQAFTVPFTVDEPGEAKLSVFGSVNVTGNKGDNLYLCKGTHAELAGTLAEDSRISVTCQQGGDVIVLKGNREFLASEADAALITNETGTRQVKYDADENAVILKAKELDETCEVQLAKTSAVYNGKRFRPQVTVTLKGEDTVLEEGRDYSCIWPTSIDADEYEVTISGEGDYTGTLTAEYSITPKSISGVSIKTSDKVYTGKAIQAVPDQIKDGTRLLLRGEDYKILVGTYKNNIKPGKASVTLQGIGNYKGKVTMYFRIKPAKMAIGSLASPKTKQLTVKWKADKKVTGYQIVLATDSKFKKNKKTVKVTKASVSSKTVKKLKSKKTYYVKMRAYKTIDGKACYGAYSKVKKLKIK